MSYYIAVATFRALLISTCLALAGAACTSKSPDQWLGEAKEALAANDLQSAQIRLKNVLQQTPEHAEARALLGQVHYLSGDYDSAEKELTRARALGASSEQVLPLLAKTWIELGQYQKVIDEITLPPHLTTASKATLLALQALAYKALGQEALAQLTLDKAEAEDAQQPVLMLVKSRFAAQAGQTEQALRWADQALQKSPRFTEAALHKAALLGKLGKGEEQRAVLKGILAHDPKQVDAWLGLAELDLQAARFDDALANLDKAQALAPSNTYVLTTRAIIELRRNNPKAANEHLLQALKSNPQHLPSILLQAIVSLGLGNYETTRKNAEHLLAQNPNDTIATRLLAAARLGLGQPREALEGLQGLLKAEDAYAHVLAAKAYMMLKDYAAATQHLELASSRMPENPELTAQLAAGHLKSGDMEQAWTLLQRLPVEDSEVRRLWHQLAEAQLQRGQAERALHTLASLEKRHQAEPLTWNLRGMAHMALNAQAQAIKSFEQALALDPNYLPALFNLAQIDLRAGRADQARRRYEAVLQRVPNNAEALLAAAHFALRAGDEQGYLSLLRRSVQADPRSPEGWRQLVAFYLSKNKANEALSVAQDGLSKNPEDPSFRELLGRAQLAAGQKDNALATFRKLVVDHPRHAPSRALQAQAYLALGDTQRARQSFQEALDLDRDFHDALIGLVQLEVREQRFDRARALVEDFKRRHPELPGVHGLEGDVHRAMGDHRAALAAYERAHRLMPSGALLVQVGDALTLLGQRQEAIARLEQWLAKHPEDQLVRHKLGGYLTESGRLDKAVLHYETLIRQNPNNPMLLNNLAWLYGQLGDPRALETAQQAHRLAPNEPLILDTYGWILLKQGRTAEALGHLRTAARQLPRHPSVQFHYAEVLARTGDKAGARSALEAALRLGLSGAERSEAEALRRQL